MFRNIPSIQKFQLFSMKSANAGIVECRESSSHDAVLFDMRQAPNSPMISPEEARAVITSQLKALPLPRPNGEKLQHYTSKFFLMSLKNFEVIRTTRLQQKSNV
jgi:hypothetical protein